MKTHSKNLALALLALALAASARAQVNSGSTGADGAFNPTTNTVINMADHPDGIYHYTSVNIPAVVTVTFISNANNTPVVWLVQGNVVISGTVDVSGRPAGQAFRADAGAAGPGGYRGGTGGPNATSGLGPGGGPSDRLGAAGAGGGNASYATRGNTNISTPPGATYGNAFIVPITGGSGGGGSANYDSSGGGGGGAIVIVASGDITINGSLVSYGGGGAYPYGGGGSGGAIRVVAPAIRGSGGISTAGGASPPGDTRGGGGHIRFDCFENAFGGGIAGSFSHGFQPIILPSAGQGTQLAIASVAGAPVAASPNGLLATPDSIIAAQASNPVAIVVRCTNLPLNTPVTVTVKPANGPAISAVGYNNSGTVASSTVTVQLNMPRGGGLIYANAATAP